MTSEESPSKLPLPAVDQLIDFLQSNPLMASLSPEELAELVFIVQLLRGSPDEIIVHQGDVGDAWYLLFEGRLQVIRGGVEVATLHPGDCFGELSALDGEPRSATVISITKSILVRIPRSGFDSLLGANSLAAYKLTLALTRVVTGRIRSLVAGELPAEADYASGEYQ
ncbi:MAG: cyclic nucleotide-binding domain-containing protein [Planctomycetes bacterium]|jgi:CRP-like cAMP-binding protein|nr:cyclic nucleotide-binding domain-containing protein [Planctomycetota bacterium]MBT6540590.1 cyclic nucleotide-binding domain-containing protein [Planctomycetota bacterium]MBT7130101.1 cyclic nucleotide-binding domain-containing protein [Planctomycetota bacterium]